MESTISTLQSARRAGCQTSDEFAAYASATWQCSMMQARTQIPSFEAYLSRVDRNNVLLSVTCHDPTQILGWDKVVLLRDCGEVMRNQPIMDVACNRVMVPFFDRVPNRVMFELFTHDNSVSITHGETQMDSEVRPSCVRHAQNAADNSRSDVVEPTEHTDGAQALMLAIESAAQYQRTHIVVIVADQYRAVDWQTLQQAKNSATGHIYITALTVGDEAQDMTPIADNIVHWCTQDGPCDTRFVDAITHANAHVSTGLKLSIRTSCSEKPYFGCQSLATVSRSTPHAKTVIAGTVTELLSAEKRGVDAFMRRDLDQAQENGVHWCGTRMVIRNENIRHWVPVVDTSRVHWQTHTRKIPLVYKVPFYTMIRLKCDANETVTISLENGNNSRSITLKGSRARTFRNYTFSQDVVAETRWRAYVAYIQDCANDFTNRHFEEIIHRAPSVKEKESWILQQQLIRNGLKNRAARIRNWTHMKRVHCIQ